MSESDDDSGIDRQEDVSIALQLQCRNLHCCFISTLRNYAVLNFVISI